MADWSMETMPEDPTRKERELVPEGDHDFEIRAASEGPHKFKEGEFLMLRLSPVNGSYSFVFVDIPFGSAGASLARSLAEALGEEAGGKVSLDPTALEGREVRAEIYHRTSANGRTYANVSRFVKPKAAKKAAAPKAVDKAAAASAPDDIPF
jgi:hypothetical protein